MTTTERTIETLEAESLAESVMGALADAPITRENLADYDERLFDAYLVTDEGGRAVLLEAMDLVESMRGALLLRAVADEAAALERELASLAA